MNALQSEQEIAAVVFDFDGTLVLSNDIKRQTFFDVVADIPGGAARMAAVLALPDVGDRHSIFTRFCCQEPSVVGLVPAHAEQLVLRYGELCEQRILQAPERPGAAELLAWLQLKGKPCFICSATPQQPLLRIVSRRYSDSVFTAVIGAPCSKDQGLRSVLQRQGLLARQLLHIGDGFDDARAAAEVGCAFAAIGGQGLVADSVTGAVEEDLNVVMGWLMDLENGIGRSGQEARFLYRDSETLAASRELS